MSKKIKEDCKRYYSGIDGLRTLAVVGVIFYHLFPDIGVGGYLGVVILFVLSGYFVTDSLLKNWRVNGKISLVSFYKKRIKRLYPELLGFFVFTITFSKLLNVHLLENVRSIFLSAVFQWNNIWQIIHGQSYFDNFSGRSPYLHLWSLSIEGQFYLLISLLFCYWIYRQKKITPKARAKAFLTLVILAIFSFALMVILYQPNVDTTRIYYGTDTRLFSLLIGSAFATLLPSDQLELKVKIKRKALWNIVGLVSVFFIGISYFLFPATHAFPYLGGMFLYSIFSCVVILLIIHPQTKLNQWLTNPVFTWIGKRSYAIYLYQLPIIVLYESSVPNIGNHPYLNSLVELVLIAICAHFSYCLLGKEQSGKNIRDHKGLQIGLILGLTMCVFSVLVLLTTPKHIANQQQDQLAKKITENKKNMEQKIPQEKNTSLLEQKYQLTSQQVANAQKLPVTTIGDSVMLATSDTLKELFPLMKIDAEVGRQVYQSIDIPKKLESQNKLEEIVLVDLGTNGSFTDEQFDRFMQAIGSKRKVYWVNVLVPDKKWQNTVNDSLHKLEKKYDNLIVLDWFDYSKGHSEWFYEDQIHPNKEGSIQLTQFVAKAILSKEK